MTIFDAEIVVRHKIRYKANSLSDAIDCAEFDFLNSDDLWLCDDVKSNWDVEIVDLIDETENKDQLFRDSIEYPINE